MMPGSLPPDPRADENVWPAARSEQRVWQPPSPKKPQPIPYTREQYVVQAPAAVHSKLAASLAAGVKTDLPTEDEFGTALCSQQRPCVQPRFIRQPALNAEVLRELQPMHEAWANVQLEPVLAYGLRVYGNGSTLRMHVDKVSDHVVSSIFHVGHHPASQP